MSPSKTRRRFGGKKSAHGSADFAEKLAQALQSDFGGLRSAIKQIAKITHAHPDTWYRGKNIPNSEYLILLTRSSPSLRDVLIELIGPTSIKEPTTLFQEKFGNLSSMTERCYNTHFSEHQVTINVTVNLNSRQNWFMLQLSHGHEIRPVHIVEHWNVTLRTAKRDLRDLTLKGLVIYVGHPKRGRYVMCGSDALEKARPK